MNHCAETEVNDSHPPKSCHNFKIVVVGDGGTGKSSYIDRLNNGDFRKEYIATLGLEKHQILVGTTQGSINITLCDTAGQEKLGPLRDPYYEGADAAIIFFDVTSRVTYKNVPLWHKDIMRVCPNAPTVICANKTDTDSSVRKVKTKNIVYHKKCEGCVGFFEISVKSQHCLKEPVEFILQNLCSDPNLKINGSLGTLFFDDFDKLGVS